MKTNEVNTPISGLFFSGSICLGLRKLELSGSNWRVYSSVSGWESAPFPAPALMRGPRVAGCGVRALAAPRLERLPCVLAQAQAEPRLGAQKPRGLGRGIGEARFRKNETKQHRWQEGVWGGVGWAA